MQGKKLGGVRVNSNMIPTILRPVSSLLKRFIRQFRNQKYAVGEIKRSRKATNSRLDKVKRLDQAMDDELQRLSDDSSSVRKSPEYNCVSIITDQNMCSCRLEEPEVCEENRVGSRQDP